MNEGKGFAVVIAPRGVAAALLVVAALVGCGGPQTGANGESDALKKARALCSNLDGSDRAECIDRKQREEEAQQLDKIRAECGADQHYDTTTQEGEREHARVEACMTQMQIEAMHEREREDLQRKQPTASKPCGEDATLSERATEEGDRRHLEYERCITQAQMRAQREREQAEDQERQDDQRRLDAAWQTRVAADTPQSPPNPPPPTEPERTEPQPQHDVQQVGMQQDREQQVRHKKHDAEAEPLAAADCQAKLDADDFAAVAPCVDQVSGQGYGSRIRSCLDSVAVALKDVAACSANQVHVEKNEDCVARALRPLVVTENSMGNSLGKRRRSCGYLDVSGYEERHLAALHVDATLAHLEADAAAQLAKAKAHDSACRLAGMIAYAQKGSATVRDVEHKTGKINYAARREISETLQVAGSLYRQALVDFRRTWKRSFNRASDCQSWTGTTCKVDSGTGVTICDVSRWAP